MGYPFDPTDIIFPFNKTEPSSSDESSTHENPIFLHAYKSWVLTTEKD